MNPKTAESVDSAVLEPPREKVGVAALVRLLGAHRGALAWSSVLTITASLLRLAVPLLAMRAVENQDGRVAAIVALAALFALQAGASSVGAYLLQRTSESVVLRLRRALVPRLLSARVRLHDEHRVGDLLSRATTDVGAIREVVMRGLVDLLTGTVTIIGAMALMIWLDWRLFLLTVLPVTIGVALVFTVLAGIRAAALRAQASLGAFAADMERALSAIRTVKANNAEPREAKRIGGHADDSYTAGVRVAKLESLVTPAMELAANGSMLVVVLVGGMRVADGSTSLGQLVAFLMALMYTVMPLAGIFGIASMVQKGLASLGRIQEVVSAPAESGRTAPAAVPEPAATAPALEFRNVSFSYGRGLALSGASFQVEAGTFTALVGLSGAGKSTVFSLAERFYEPQDGEILINGVPVDRFPSPQAVRSRTALVEQSCPVLHGTLRENLVYGRPDATDEEIADVVHRVRLDGLIAKLPRGLDTLVGDHGSALSGGERQRVAIARAVLRRPGLLLLDEPTSALDPVNEAALSAVIKEVSTSCATLVIAHRISTIRQAEKIIVLDAGKVVGVGSHDDLVRDNTFYQALALSR
ncbi:ABC transporter ATP-binding protein [Streptomyces alkaliterrae]|uniref:ABC transporter ATP-binding protein n=1 Tax=Streptomyces alkaliterrae TaxID=2213162 RepID=A0A5P0YKH0_9ACTN|nr:ABC transporter ATP-binding protein [Streptomyces alkaliterrae]MBB1252705.1 ABC transporter ATP-binding protein [Streptomyces alkaliterrae]MBB1258887.1 ABC transporter ATP-binding protein [Streptomyces alkaliterrae]MQS00864.1 ATP-binding cassette domain-containing protein [Streptomyces alkaliterrae]